MQTYNFEMKDDPLAMQRWELFLGGKDAENLQVKLFNIADLYPGKFKLGTCLWACSISIFRLSLCLLTKGCS